jgi:hypothetical protein
MLKDIFRKFIEGRLWQRPSGPGHDHFKLVDEGFLASWGKNEGIFIKNYVDFCRQGVLDEVHADMFFSELNKSIKRKWNDQKSGYEAFEPLEASYKYDKITDYGLSLFCALIVGKSVPLISHMGIGDGTGDSFDYQDTLYAEKVRYAFADQGYINSLGRTLRFHMTFDIMLASADYSEIGLFNNPTLGTGPLVARSVFNPSVSHTSGFNYITGSYLISTLSA